MIEKIRNIGYGVLGYGFAILIFVAFGLLIVGGAKLFEAIYPFLEGVSSITWGIVWLLLLLSVVPRFRNFTGSWIVVGTYIGGAIFWLLCFYVTYSLWGLIGIFVGVLFFGLGVFFTALLALIFDGQFMGALGFAFVLAQIFFFRYIGYWIISKYRGANRAYVTSNNEIVNNEEYSDLPELVEGESPTTSYCGKCGNKVEDNSKFCSKCGAEI